MQQTRYIRNMAVPDGDFTSPMKSAPEMIQYLFEGNITSYLILQGYTVYSDYYLKHVPAVGSAHPQYAGVYFIKDQNISHIGGALIKFERVYGVLPGFNLETGLSGSIRKEAESYVYSKPGVNTVNTYFIYWNIDNDAVTYTATNVTLYTMVNPTTSDRYEQEVSTKYDNATIAYDVIDPIPGGGGTITTYTYTTPILASDTTYITVARPPYQSVATTDIYYLYFSCPQVKLNPMQTVVPSYLYYDYWMPGLNCSSEEDIPLTDPFTITDENGNETDTVTETTDPTINEYKAMVTAKQLIQVEYPTIKRFMGNIFERQRRYIHIV